METNRRRITRIVFSFLISAVFSYFVIKGVDFKRVYGFLLTSDWIYVVAAFLTIVFAQFLRSLRWGVMLNPLESMRQDIVFPITSVGFMLISLLPARLGEFARPYLLCNNTKISFSSAMATIVLERILDAIFILVFFGAIISKINLPSWIEEGVLFIILSILVLIVFLLFGRIKWVKNILNHIIQRALSERVAKLIEGILEKFYRGMTVLGRGTHTLLIVFLTACIWGSFVLVNFLLFKAFHMELGMFAALTALTLTALGISIPAGPGFIGSFHFFCVLGLSLFQIEKNLALTYALVNHALILSTFSLLGLISINLPGLKMGLSLSRLFPLSEETSMR